MNFVIELFPRAVVNSEFYFLITSGTTDTNIPLVLLKTLHLKKFLSSVPSLVSVSSEFFFIRFVLVCVFPVRGSS